MKRALDLGRRTRGDALVTGAIVLLAVLEAVLGTKLHGPVGLRLLGALAIVLPLAWRRRSGLAACVLTLAAIFAVGGLGGMPGDPPIFVLLAFVVASYAPAAYEDLPRALIGGAVTVAAMSVFVFVGGHEATRPEDIAFGYAEVVVAWVFGRAMRRRELRGEQLEERAVTLEREQERQAQRAVADERRRIARELHDVVAHGVSVMVVQAQAGSRVLRSDPDRAAQALSEIEAAGRQALVELERMLGVMRPDDSRDPALTPSPRLADVAELVARARTAGLPTTLRVEGAAGSLSRGLELAAYRVLQEALTNALKHGGGAQTDVLVNYGTTELELRVANELREPLAFGAGRNGTGHGLIGMRERVALYHGTLEVGRRVNGGFAVRARLPLGDT
jgi:signal transduction histidine kinase